MRLRYGWAILRAPELPPDEGGGGGGNNPPPVDPPTSVTVDDVGRIVNSAITSHLKKLNISGQINEAIGALKIDDKFSGLTKVLEGLKPTPPTPPPGGGGGGDTAKDEEIRAMKKQLENLATAAERAEAARVQAEANANQVRLDHEFSQGRSKLYESLKEHADPSLHDVWVDNLVHHKRIKVEGGVTLLEVEYAPVKGMPKTKDFLPLEEALPHLIESTDAKRFMSAPTPDPKNNPGPKGGGRRPPSNINSQNPIERARALLEQQGINFDSEFSG